jgi:hypothetical protein
MHTYGRNLFNLDGLTSSSTDPIITDRDLHEAIIYCFNNRYINEGLILSIVK